MATQASNSIRELDEAFARHINSGDAEALAGSFYAEEALLLPPNHPAVRGRVSIGHFWRGLLDAGLSDLHVETTETRASGTFAFATGRYSLAFRGAAGEPVRDTGKWLAIYRQQADKSWRAVNHMFSSDQAAT